jgi:hypothetical protein
MGKLKETLLNSLTPEEMNERYELSAFEFVEYMAPQLENDMSIDDINESIKVKYSDSDIQQAISVVSDNSPHTNKVFELFIKELNDIYTSKMGYE